MAVSRKWSNVAIAMQSALGSALTITGITKASPGVVTSTSHGLSNGNYVLLTVQGMFQVNSRVFRVANVATNTFELEGENTTSYDTFTSGNAKLITYGTSITSATNVTASGGEFEDIDNTTVHQNNRTTIPGPASPISYTFDNIWDPSDAGQLAMKAAYDAQGERAFRFTFGTGGPIMAFNGSVGASLIPTGQAQGLITSPAVIKLGGSPTFYAS